MQLGQEILLVYMLSDLVHFEKVCTNRVVSLFEVEELCSVQKLWFCPEQYLLKFYE